MNQWQYNSEDSSFIVWKLDRNQHLFMFFLYKTTCIFKKYEQLIWKMAIKYPLILKDRRRIMKKLIARKIALAYVSDLKLWINLMS